MQDDTIRRAGALLAAAWRDGTQIMSTDLQVRTRDDAAAVQDATIALLGRRAAWKVGAKTLDAPLTCSPLPASRLFESGAHIADGRMRGVELEVAFRMAREWTDGDRAPTAQEWDGLIDAFLPAIEVVETRLADKATSDAWAQNADLQSHGALVIGAPVKRRFADVDLRAVHATLAFDGQVVADARGAHTAPDLMLLAGWLARDAAARGRPLRAGEIVTTGSCTGLLFGGEGMQVAGEVDGLGKVDLRF